MHDRKDPVHSKAQPKVASASSEAQLKVASASFEAQHKLVVLNSVGGCKVCCLCYNPVEVTWGIRSSCQVCWLFGKDLVGVIMVDDCRGILAFLQEVLGYSLLVESVVVAYPWYCIVVCHPVHFQEYVPSGICYPDV